MRTKGPSVPPADQQKLGEERLTNSQQTPRTVLSNLQKEASPGTFDIFKEKGDVSES